MALEDELVTRQLMHKLRVAFPETQPYKGKIANPAPHLTVAKVEEKDQVERVMDELGAVLLPHVPIEVKVDRIMVMEEGEDLVWRTRLAIPLQL